jgi:hypothetical protein
MGLKFISNLKSYKMPYRVIETNGLTGTTRIFKKDLSEREAIDTALRMNSFASNRKHNLIRYSFEYY